ncbi:formate dehydrogenase O, cytochrome b556 subunit [Candidatus Sulfopaludibacter sp. SbA4]|nr:formate dehydrogenase O, cytochrome b556 subunit [Candidatus Sulfopaludibacter sp. SbA4]
MNDPILRYTLVERVMHWIAALTYTYVLLTGLAFYSPHLYWIATILGGAPTSRFWHPWLGVVFALAIAWMLRAWLADMRITPDDRRWGQAIQHYVRNEDENLPPIGRFNLGQKQFFWIMFYAAAVLLITGAVLWFPERIPWSLRALRYAAILLHVAAALITIGLFIIHVYMGTAVVRGGFTSIIRGEVSPAWARTHHRLWYDRVTGR